MNVILCKTLLVLKQQTEYEIWLAEAHLLAEYEQNAEEKQQHKARLQEGIDRKKAHIEKSIQVGTVIGPLASQ